MNLTEEAWRRLHEVRLRGIVQGPEDEHVAELVDAGLAVRRGSSTLITPVGRAAHAQWARIPEGSEQETLIRRAYEQFLALDREVKQLTTEWQMAFAGARPHGYSPEDWKLIDRLIALEERAGPVILRLQVAIPRLSVYGDRLREALRRLRAGERQWWSGVNCESFHNVWWQLHEELLIALGISRGEDPNQ